MNWTGAVSSSTLGGSSTLNIYGSLILNANMNVTFNAGIYFKSNSPGNIIQTFGKTLSSPIYFDGLGGEWTLQDNFNLANGIDINLIAGSFNTNDKTVSAYRFVSASGGICFLTLGSSTINLSSEYPNPGGYSAWFIGSNLTLSSGTSTINLTGSTSSFYSAYPFAYYNINFAGTTSGALQSSSNTIFHNVSFAGNASVAGGNAIFNNLTLGTSKTTSISGTQTINGTFTCNGTAAVFAAISGGTLNKASGTVCINYLCW
jgi:hypothetical protein